MDVCSEVQVVDGLREQWARLVSDRLPGISHLNTVLGRSEV
jgi:hypothetical protein